MINIIAIAEFMGLRGEQELKEWHFMVLRLYKYYKSKKGNSAEHFDR